MGQLFDDEILRVSLQFSANAQDIDAARKSTAQLSQELDKVVRESARAGRSLKEVVESFNRVSPVLRKMESGANSVAAVRANEAISKYRAGRAESLYFDEKARLPLAEPSTPQATRRRATLDSRLQKFEEAVERATKTFESYRSVVVPQRQADILRRFEERERTITRSLMSASLSADSQVQRIDAYRKEAEQRATRRLSTIQRVTTTEQASLGLSAMEAEMERDRTMRAAQRRADAMRKSGKFSEEEIQRRTSDQVQEAAWKAEITAYQRDVSGMTSQKQIASFRKQTAERLATVRYGAATPETTVALSSLLSGETLAQGSSRRKAETQAGLAQQLSSLDQQAETTRRRRVLAEDREDQYSSANRRKRIQEEGKLEEDVAKKAEKAVQAREKADSSAHQARVKALRVEEGAASLRGGTTRGVGGGGGRGKGIGAQEGEAVEALRWGMGAAALAAYLGTMREIVRESTLYAARTETLALVTDQMSKVNGINTEQVEAEVQAVKKLNITTQEAHETVQKMMFAQLDVAKATKLARVAQDSAVLANVNSSEALSRIIQGIVTGQTRMLHNMGLQVSMLSVIREIRADKKQRGETGDPTEMEKRQGMLNKVLLEGSKIMGTYERSMLTAGKQFNSLQREIQEAQNAIGNEFLPEFGRAVSWMTNSLHYVQAHGEAFASLASALTSVGVAASTISSFAFLRWAMTATTVPFPIKALGIATGLAVNAVMNQDTGAALNFTANEAMHSSNKRLAALVDERKQLLAGKSDSSEWRATFEANTAGIQSMLDGQLAIQQEHTKKLADEYGKRVADLESFYSAAQRAAQGQGLSALESLTAVGKYFWYSLSGKIKKSPYGPNWKEERGASGEHARDKAWSEQQYLESLGGGIASPEAIREEYESQRRRKQRVAMLGPTLVNKELLQAQFLASRAAQYESDIQKYEEGRRDVEGHSMQSALAGAPPRERVRIQAEYKLHSLRRDLEEIDKMEKEAKGGGDIAKGALEDRYKSIGQGSIVAGREKIADIRKNIGSIEAQSREDVALSMRQYDIATASAILQSKAQVKEELIRSATIKGSYESERAEITEVFALRKQTAEATRRIDQDIDQYRKSIASAEADYQKDLIRLEKQRTDAARERLRLTSGWAGERGSEAALSATGVGAKESIEQAYMARIRAAGTDPDEERRARAILDLYHQMGEAVRKLAKDRATLAAESSISEFEDRQNLQIEIDRITSSRGGRRASSQQRALDEIERTRLSQRSISENRYQKAVSLEPSGEPRAFRDEKAGQERDKANRAADFAATSAKLKELHQQEETARQTVAEGLEQRYSMEEKLAHLKAFTAADEETAAQNLYVKRLDYIQKEYEIRGRTQEALKQKMLADQQAAFDQLQRALEQQKRDLDAVRATAGSLFDAATTSGDRSKAMQDYLTGIGKNIAKTMFQNFSVEMMKDKTGALGGLFGGQYKTDASGNKTPTLMGRILSGTPFAAKTGKDEIQALEIKTRQEGNDIETELVRSIQSLDEAVRAAQGLSASTASGTTASGLVPWMASGSELASTVASSTGLGTVAAVLGGSTAATAALTRVFSGAGGSSSSSSTTATTSSDLLSNTLGGSGSVDVSNKSVDLLASTLGKSTNKTSQSAGRILGGTTSAVAGGLQAFSGFSQGGVSGTASGVGGVLTAGAGVASMFGPAGMAAAGFMAAGAAIADTIASIFKSSIEKRKEELTTELAQAQYMDQTAITATSDTTGHFTDYSATGAVRTSDLLPYSTVEDEYSYEKDGTYYTVSGRTTGQYTEASTAAKISSSTSATTDSSSAQTVVNINVSALDASSFSKYYGGTIAKSLREVIDSGQGDDLLNTLSQRTNPK